MADKLTREKRSWNMSRIRRKNTEIEIKVADMPGKPDIVLSKYKTIIFIHGCYWHRHASCKNCTTPNTNREFWLKKFEKNMQNDSKHQQELEAAGWKVLILWECEIENDFERLMDNLVVELQRPAQPG